MKKLIIVATVLFFASCGSGTETKETSTDSTKVDSSKVIVDSIKVDTNKIK